MRTNETNIITDNKLDLELLISAQQRPGLFSEREELFWDDPHISKQMLEAHLDPDTDLASYNHNKIDKTVDWIVDHLGLKQGSRVLDLGCGPGLFSSRLSKMGMNVVGVDYSKNSISYASGYAKENNLDIEYIYQNYLEIDYNSEFDAILLICYDFGALTNSARDILLGKIRKALKPDGVFIFDVFTRDFWEQTEWQNWYAFDAGFWRPYPHLVLEKQFHYEEDNVFLHQQTIIEDSGKLSTYKIWDHYYSRESIAALLKEHGYATQDIWSDLTGKPFEEGTKLLGVSAKAVY